MNKTPKKVPLDISHPELAKEWHPTKNGDLTPQDVSAGSSRKVWWICDKGHEWKALISNRTYHGTKCPYCSGKKAILGQTDLATTHPDIAKEWHPTKNGSLTPNDVTAGSNKVVWWKCEQGHEWKTSIDKRTIRGDGCPYCAGKKIMVGFNDLQTLFPDIAKEWHPTKNGKLSPKDVAPYSGKKVWWQCNKGHVWKTRIATRTKDGTGCPYCSGHKVMVGETDLATTHPDIAKEWHPTKNGNLTPKDVSAGSNRKVWWQCEQGHEWKALVSSRTGSKTRRGTGCPYCNPSTSFPEQAIYYYVKGVFPDAINRYDELGFELDIFIPSSINTAIEYDGVYWHENKMEEDNKKDQRCIDEGIRLIRIREAGLEKTYNAINILKEDLTDKSLCSAINKLFDYLSIQGVSIDLETDRQAIYSAFNMTKKEASLSFLYPNLAQEWHPTKNGDLTPENVTASSNKIVWWRCSKGHEWKARIADRSSKAAGCPYCAGKKVIVGETDLATTHPDLAQEWHPTKNGDLTPQNVSAGSNKKVWWKCKQGHEWKAVIYSRAALNAGCPYCSGRNAIKDKNDLATTHPDVAKEWHPTKNGDLTPQDIKAGSDKRVWWMSDTGREWQASVKDRTRNKPVNEANKLQSNKTTSN